jgi:hypothetical protein
MHNNDLLIGKKLKTRKDRSCNMIVLNVCNTIQYANPLGFMNATTLEFRIEGLCTIASINEEDGKLPHIPPPPNFKILFLALTCYSWP